MSEFEKDRKLEKQIMAIINFYKLIYIEKLTYDKNMDTFIMLGGKKAINKLKMDVDNNNIFLNKSNLSVIASLSNKFDKYNNGHISSGSNFREEIANLGWLPDVMDDVDEKENLYDTLVVNSNSAVYDNIIEPTFNKEITNYHKRCLMKKKAKTVYDISNQIK